MATIDVLDLAGSKVGSLELADEVFGAINEDLLWEAVKHYRAGLRAGTHATKNRKLVSGAGKKLVEAEGNRARPCRVDSLATVASRRHDSRTAASLLRLPVSAQEGAGRVAFGAGGQGGGWQADGRRGVST